MFLFRSNLTTFYETTKLGALAVSGSAEFLVKAGALFKARGILHKNQAP
jgi:hypothetical protein